MTKDETIKAGVEKDEVKKAPKVEKTNKIEVDADTLKELINQNKKFQSDIIELQKNAVAQNPNQSNFNNMEMMKTAKKETLLKMRKWQDKYWIGFVNKGKENKPLYVYSEYNPQTREQVQFCDVILDGQKEPVKLEYVEFLRESERVLVKMKKKILYYAMINFCGLHTDKGKPIKLFDKDGAYWSKCGNYGDHTEKIPVLGKTKFKEGFIEFYSNNEQEVQTWIDGAVAFKTMIKNFCGKR
jgi:hypothetical protein